jgi:plastocyanin
MADRYGGVRDKQILDTIRFASVGGEEVFMSASVRILRAPVLGIAAMLVVACSSSTSPTSTTGTGVTADGGGAPDASDPTETPDASPSTATHVVNVSDFAYEPAKLKIAVGDTVRWVWTDGTHTVTEGTSCTAKTGGFDSGRHTAAFTYEHTFDAAGTFDYFCDYREHCTMMGQVGTVEVAP